MATNDLDNVVQNKEKTLVQHDKKKLEIKKLYIPESNREVQLIEGEDEADSGKKLALRLHEEKLI